MSALHFCWLSPGHSAASLRRCYSEGNWSREKQLCWRFETLEERSGWGVVVVFSCMQPDPKTQVQVPCSPLSIPHPNPSSQLQSVCPLDPPLNPDYYGFVFFKLVICKDKGLIKVIWQGLFAANQ